MKTFDLHQDLMTHVRFRDQLGQEEQTSFAAIEQSDIDLVVATAFPFPPNDDQTDPAVSQLISEELHLYRDFLTKNSHWQLIETAADLESDQQKILLHLEGLNVFDGSEAAWIQLREWITLGVRSIGTHWNIENKLGGGTLQPNVGLTLLGYEVLSFLEQSHLVFDMAHMSRQSFWDATAVTNRPLYVSHGNADAIFPHVRNYTDEQLKAIAETDGVIGVFFAQSFVTGREISADIEAVVRHINYIRDLIGIRHIAVGSDWGGIVNGGVAGLKSVSELPNLFNALTVDGYTESDLMSIATLNAKRVLQAHLSES